MSDILLGAGNVPQQAFEQFNDPLGNKLIALNRDGSIFAQGGIEFADGTVQTTAGGGGVGGVLTVTVVIPAARVTSLGSNPYNLVPGVPGAIISAVTPPAFVLSGGSTPYTLNGADTLWFYTDRGLTPTEDNNEINQVALPGTFDQAPPQAGQCQPFTAISIGDVGLGINVSTILGGGAQDIDISGGSADLKITFHYSLFFV